MCPVAETWALLNLIVDFPDGTFLRTLATSLMDFNELSSIAALSQLLEVGLTWWPTPPEIVPKKLIQSFNLKVKFELNIKMSS